jgi:hypothetical protein
VKIWGNDANSLNENWIMDEILKFVGKLGFATHILGSRFPNQCKPTPLPMHHEGWMVNG